ncbi:coniferyl-aldehyde dehydrogenase [Desulfatibacillum alkenivorans DSM 16219]|jgi:coniferyl-aldehyde dehydrogenase|uniref:Aldehyde dehydrogenase n=1 Tax=Desulfatibacillum alkenivorans DSM 16219 TaxID=1121393 RepID=A0A1M6IH13_9BACT|nr:coniferyl aldehyde dehydrogenase [Desulfatibacillum alkenivorans]SHJ33708.1 coniferyl-aldehyde dehydrogenase [Desulfatibacillum alkenivorans DSM 16219]
MTTARKPNSNVAAMVEILEAQKAAFIAQGPTSYQERIKELERIETAIGQRVDEIVEAMVQDFGSRSRHEILIAEINTTLSMVHYTKKHLKKWMKPRKRSVGWLYMPGKARVYMEPLGVVGVISPWNYPFYLAMVPTLSALAAGNRVMLKPSVFTPRTSQCMKDLLGAIFPPDKVSVIFSGPGVGSAFSRLPFDHICFTGSTSVGKQVMAAAAENLTPVTLELGGKSPAIVGQDFDVQAAADRIAHGKFFNAGQTCIAPDYALVPENKVNQFVEAFEKAIRTCYPTLENNPDFTSIITTRHFDRLHHAIKDAEEKGAKVIRVNPANEEIDPATKKIAPTIVLNGTEDMILLQDEIFGPILPVLPYSTLDEAIAYVNARPRPLALYYFSNKDRWVQKVLKMTQAGGTCINNTLLHVAQDDLPFGGVGFSGMGSYHGPEGFDTFSNKRGVFFQGSPCSTRLIRAPYSAGFEKALRFMIDKL